MPQYIASLKVRNPKIDKITDVPFLSDESKTNVITADNIKEILAVVMLELQKISEPFIFAGVELEILGLEIEQIRK